jgi:sulfur carrier protein ThiS
MANVQKIDLQKTAGALHTMPLRIISVAVIINFSLMPRQQWTLWQTNGGINAHPRML